MRNKKIFPAKIEVLETRQVTVLLFLRTSKTAAFCRKMSLISNLMIF